MLIPVLLTPLQVEALIEAANRADATMRNARLRRAASAGADKLEAALQAEPVNVRTQRRVA